MLYRLAYPVFLLENLVEKHCEPDGVEIFVLYDVACSLTKHLQVRICIVPLQLVLFFVTGEWTK